MATRFYFPEAEAAAVSPTISAAWSHINTVRRRLKMTTPDSSTLANQTYNPDGTDHLVAGDAHNRQYVSDPLAAQQLSGTVKAQFQASEANGANNLFITLKIFVCGSDGTVKEDLLTLTRDTTLELGTGITNRTFSSIAIATVDIELNDRIVVEVGYGGTPTAAGATNGHNGAIRYGGSASGGDLPENDTEAGTTFRPWIEFSDNISLAPTAITVSVNQVTETDTVQAITRVKQKASAQVTETDSVQTVARVKRLTLAQVSESDTVTAVAWAPRHRLAAQTTEADLAQAITRVKRVTAGQVAETDAAQAVTLGASEIVVSVAQVTETDAAQTVTRVKRQTLAQTTETESAQALAAKIKARSLGQVAETDSVHTVVRVKRRAVAQSLETDAVLAPLLSRKQIGLQQALESDIAQAVAVGNVTLGSLFRAGRVPIRFVAASAGVVPVRVSVAGAGVVPVVVTTVDEAGVVPCVITPDAAGVVPIVEVP